MPDDALDIYCVAEWVSYVKWLQAHPDCIAKGNAAVQHPADDTLNPPDLSKVCSRILFLRTIGLLFSIGKFASRPNGCSMNSDLQTRNTWQLWGTPARRINRRDSLLSSRRG